MSGKSDTPQSFYNAIFKTFDKIPMVMGPNNNGQGGYGLPTKKSKVITLANKDLENFKKLFSPAGISKNTGNGEVALYWLFNCDAKNIDKLTKNGLNQRCTLNQGGNEQTDPDLKVGNKLLEVKSYPGGAFAGSGKGKLEGLTRFSRFKQFIKIANLLAAADNFLNEEQLEEDSTGIQNLSFVELKPAAEHFCMLRSVIRRERLQEYTVFQKMDKKMKTFDDIAKQNKVLKECVTSDVGGDEIAKRILAFLCLQAVGGRETKQQDGLSGGKPGFGNFMVNVDSANNGKIEFLRVDENGFNLDSLMQKKNFSVAGGTIQLNFKEVFGT